jgi:hypothetical protein
VKESARKWEFAAIPRLPSGAVGFVTHGRDGKIAVIDTATRAIDNAFALPTTLDYDGSVPEPQRAG